MANELLEYTRGKLDYRALFRFRHDLTDRTRIIVLELFRRDINKYGKNPVIRHREIT